MLGGEMSAGGTFVLVLIWVVIGLALLVWYLWAMSRLFARIGLPEKSGWVPIYNDYLLLNRTGLPGWSVVLWFVGLGIVPFIIRIIAMHRLNTEADTGAGYTVAGVVLPPLWATMLGNFLEDEEMLPQNRGRARQDEYDRASYFGIVEGQSPEPSNSPEQGIATRLNSTFETNSAFEMNTTAEIDAEYARLAAEQFQAPPATPLGNVAAPELFSWTKATAPKAAPAPEQPAPVMGVPEVAADEMPPLAQPAPQVPPQHTAPKFSWALQLPNGERFALAPDTVVGRKPVAFEGATPLELPDPTRTLSKTHARLRFDGGRWSIEDLSSTNGTVLLGSAGNEQLVSAGWPVPATERFLLGTLEVRLVQ